jgi:CheY-like chemotaxis protein
MGVHALRGRAVMIVDDNATNVRILALECARLEMVPATYSGGHDALAALEAAPPPAIIVLDMEMPELTGLDVARRVRDRFSPAEVAIIIMSSSRMPSREDIDALGLAAVLTKPARSLRFQHALEAALTPTLAHAQAAPTPAAAAPKRNLGLRVLLAEDNPINQRVATLMLNSFGCITTVVDNGARAINALERSLDFDVILMDMQMPEMDGLEATQQIIRRWGGRRPPIVALTANVMESDRQACLAAGMDDFLPKPFQRSALLSMLERATSIDGGHGGRAVASGRMTSRIAPESASAERTVDEEPETGTDSGYH